MLKRIRYSACERRNALWIVNLLALPGRFSFNLPRVKLAFVLVGALLALPLRAQMTLAEVTAVLQQAVSRAAVVAPNAVVAVVDREGFVLGVWSVNGAPPTAANQANAIAKAGTAAFLSSAQNAFTPRTAAMIVQQNFPPGVVNKPPGPLVGVNFSQLAFSDINKYKLPAEAGRLTLGSSPAAPLTQIPTPLTGGLAGTAGGVPLYRAGVLIGGVGVAGDGDNDPLNITASTVSSAKVDEDVALAGQVGFAPSPRILGNKVFVDGIALAYVASTTSLGVVTPLGGLGAAVAGFAPTASPAGPLPYVPTTLGGVSGEIRQAIIPDTTSALVPALRLTAAEVTAILTAGANRARTTRAGIRLPRGVPMQVFISVVNNPNAAGTPPVCLGTFCTSPDTTRFSWDVCVQKARTAVFFSSDARGFSARTVGFMAQGTYPPGIAGTTPGIFLGLQERFSIITPGGSVAAVNTLNGAAFNTSVAVNPNLPNGMTIFAGSMPLYRGGVLIGAVGVSGDGIDQDDLVAASAAAALGGIFLPPEPVRADRSLHRGARLPLVKFPRNPAL
ncbi:MAG: heme-binding protein [Verrucomicrobia bacterium]|nr:heme-binding protein [Verrucomicrobiota bacterium]